jgi:L-asparaginase
MMAASQDGGGPVPTLRKHIVILTTGGTIAMQHDDAAGGAVPQLTGRDLQSAIASPHATVSTEEVCSLPSAHFTLDTLWTVRQRVATLAAQGKVTGIVITHGTDVMEETATLLDLTADTDMPIVLTGAMRTASDLGYDGFSNLSLAVRVASADSARALGTLVAFNDSVHSARYVTKMHTQSIDTFGSPDWGPLGRLDADGLHFAYRVTRRIIPCPALERRVELVKLAVGMAPDVLPQAIARGTRGLVIEALGGGRVPPWWLAALRDAIGAGVAVVVCSRCPSGRVGDGYGYAGAQRDLRGMGCLPGGCLNGQKARIGLMVALGGGLAGAVLREAWQRIAALGE